MIDYDKTLKLFFSEIIKYLNDLASHAEDGITYARIEHARDVIGKIMETPFEYSDYDTRVRKKSELWAEAFMPNKYDNSVFRLYSGVLYSMGDLNSQHDDTRKQAQDKLLNSLKAIKYKNSKNILKGLYFPFVSAKKYAVDANMQKTK